MAEAIERLLVVEEAFFAGGRGVLVSPRFTAPSPPRGPIAVQLRLPGGGERTVTAGVDIAHVTGALAPYAMFRLPELRPEEVPPGTEIWGDPALARLLGLAGRAP